MVDVYHESQFPFQMMSSICRSLKNGGRVAIVESAEDPAVPIKPLHKISEAQVRKEMKRLPLVLLRTSDKLPRQHLILFEKTFLRCQAGAPD